MRFTSQTKHNLSRGFTLVEVLIIAPIVVLVIGGFVGLMMALVGDVLLTRDQNVMAYETQDALDRIEQDTRIGTQFLDSSRALTAPQGKNDGTGAFTSSDSLIMGALATDRNPASPERQLIYYADQPAACGSSSISQNRVFINKIIYYVKNGSLWRRVIVPTYNTDSPSNLLTTCGDPWQQNSCSPGYTLTPPCKANDAEVMKNIQSFNVKYYSSPSATTELTDADILTATTIDVTITGTKTTSGKVATTSGTVRASKLNSIEADIPPPTAPVVSHTVGDSPKPNVSFTWSAVQHATSYKVSYTIDGGSATNVTVAGGTTYYNVPANRNQTVEFKVSSLNSSGQSPDATDSATLPPWTYVETSNDWIPYSSTFQSPAYTITPDGVVVLKGLIKDGTATTGTLLFNLPPGYRPEKKLIFIVGSYASGSGTGRIDIAENGDVTFVSGTSTWISLDSIHFLHKDAPYTWTTLTLPLAPANWTHYSTPTETFSQLKVTKDAKTRVHVNGLIRNGTATSNAIIANLPAGYNPPQYAIFPGADTGTTFSAFGVNGTTVVARGLYTSYISTQAMYYPSSYNGWSYFSGASTSPYNLSNGWTWYNSPGYGIPQYTKQDGIVTVKGLIKNGTNTNGTVIANLPVGYRPIKKMIFPALGAASGNGGHTRLDVATNGNITIEGGIPPVAYLSLDSISFIAE